MRVLFALEHFHPYVGGAETLFANLATGLAEEGHEITVITSRLAGTAREEMWRGVKIVRVATPARAKRYVFMFSALPAILRHGRGCDLIHTTTYNAAIPAAVAGAVWRRPVVITVHEVFGKQWHQLPGMNRIAGLGYRAFEWLVLHLPFSRFICDSDFTRERLLRMMSVQQERACTVYPILDHDFWNPELHRAFDLRGQIGVPPETYLYLYFGRPGVSKGVEYLVKAAQIVRQQLPGSRLVMLLSNDPPGQYRRIVSAIDALGLTDHVTLLPPVERSRLPGHLLAADCVVVPSLSEGFGYSALEAATLGCRVIATSGHASEEVLAGVAEFVPPRDPQALAAKIVSMALPSPPPPRPRRFEPSKHVREVLQIYQEVMDEQ